MVKNYLQKIILKKLFIIFLITSQLNSKVDLIVFSFDRAMQLYALFESIDKYVIGINEINLILRTSNQQHKEAYKKVFNNFAKKFKINIWEEQQNPNNFKELVLKCINNIKNDYIIFAVDDNIVIDFIDFNECCEIYQKQLINNARTYGLYLRLGKNINQHYGGEFNSTPLPSSITKISDKFLTWQFKTSKGDWAYPNTVDMTLYKKSQIINTINKLNFKSPNTFEGKWSLDADLSNFGICYEKSKVVNIPANIVQKDFITALNMKSFSTEDLLIKFNQGFKIDIQKFHLMNNNCCHFNQIYTFIKR